MLARLPSPTYKAIAFRERVTYALCIVNATIAVLIPRIERAFA